MAAEFMSWRARRSLGLVKAYLAERAWKERPSSRMRMYVDGRRGVWVSKCRVYSYLGFVSARDVLARWASCGGYAR